jgi:transcriptional regulator with XRE-family HTH domain
MSELPYLKERILLSRRSSGMSQAELARRSGINLNTISRIERGHSKIVSAHIVLALAKALGTTPNVLMGVDPVE